MDGIDMYNNTTKIKLSVRQRIDYAVYDFGYMLVYYWVNAFLTIYYTDVIGVSLAAVATLTLVLRVFDALNDPIIGSIADRTKSKNGRYRPWLRYGGLAMGVLIILMFSARPEWAESKKMIWMWITYVGVTVASTCNYMPYAALCGVMTSDSGERNKLSAYRGVGSSVSGQIAAMIAVPLILAFAGSESGPEAASGYSAAVTICALIFIFLAFYTSAKTREVVTPPPKQKGIPLKMQFACVFKNKYAIILIIAFLMLGIGQYGRMAMILYYFQYVACDLGLNTIAGIITLVACLLGSGFCGIWLYNLTHHKGRVAIIAFSIHAVFAIPLYFFPATSVFFWICLFISQCAMAAVGSGVVYGMFGDVVDYGEYKYGYRVDGFVSSFISLTLKTGGAIGPALIIFIIDSLGFVPNAVQNQNVLNVLSGSISILLAICAAIAIIAFLFYDLDDKKLADIRSEIDRCHEAQIAEIMTKTQ